MWFISMECDGLMVQLRAMCNVQHDVCKQARLTDMPNTQSVPTGGCLTSNVDCTLIPMSVLSMYLQPAL